MKRVVPTSYFGRAQRKPYFLLIVQREMRQALTKTGSMALFRLEPHSSTFGRVLWGARRRNSTNLSNADVRKLIGHALKKGWLPDVVGPSFVVQPDEVPDLPNFRLALTAA